MAKPQKIKNSDGSTSYRIRWVNADGKQVGATFPKFDLAREELVLREAETLADRVRRSRNSAASMTVTEAWERFKAKRKQDSSDTERRFKARGYVLGMHYTKHIEPHLGGVKLCDLTTEVVGAWLDKLAETTTARPGEKNPDKRTLSASTIRSIATTMRQIAKANRVKVEIELGDSLKQKRKRSRPKAFQCIEDVRAFLGGCRDPWFKVAAAISCFAGARLGEVASLRYRHVGERTITIASSWEGPLKHRYEEDDDEGAARVVPLAPELAEIIAAWRKITNGQDDDRIVLVNGTRPLREGFDDMAQKTRAACKRAKVTPLTFHSLRASYATLAANAGLPIAKLQALLGHADAATVSIYIRPESDSAAFDPRAVLGRRSVDDGRMTDSAMLN